MKKLIFVLLCFIILVSTVSCALIDENGNWDIQTSGDKTADSTANSDTTNSDTTDAITPCVHTFGEWSVSKEATERADGEEKRVCSHCRHSETKPIHAKGTEGLLFTLLEDGMSYSVNAGSATEGDVFIPAYHNGLPVTSIGYIGFANVQDDDSIENFEIGQYGFLKCNNLKSVVIPSTVTVIGDWAFVLCENLESIVIPESVKEVGEFAFALSAYDIIPYYYCEDIKVSIPDSEVILILRELGFWGFGVEIYYLDESGNEVLIANTTFDDSYVFSAGNFEIINNNDATFTVRAGSSSDKEYWTEKTFDIPQCVSAFEPKVEYTVTVFYSGSSREEWDASNIIKPGKKKYETNPLVYYYSETEPTEPNKFWHYVDGIPVLW